MKGFIHEFVEGNFRMMTVTCGKCDAVIGTFIAQDGDLADEISKEHKCEVKRK